MDQKQECVDVSAYLRELICGIDSCFDDKPNEARSPKVEREQSAAALAVVGRFLLKLDPKHADRFFDLSDALIDLNGGARPPILRSPKKRSPPNSTQVEAAKADVAFALEALIELGAKPNEAASMLVRKFEGIKNLAGPKSQRQDYFLTQTILEWRKSLSAPSRKKNYLAAEIFLAGRELIKSFIENDRGGELKARAIGRAKHAAEIGVFLAATNTN